MAERHVILFDMRKQDEMNEWINQTLHFALVSSGQDDVTGEDLANLVNTDIRPTLQANYTYQDIVIATLKKANEKLGVEVEIPNQGIEPEYLNNVIDWGLKSIAVTLICRRRAHDHEKLEAILEDKIVQGVQGNRTAPTRDDLDKIVRKTIAWCLKELGVAP